MKILSFEEFLAGEEGIAQTEDCEGSRQTVREQRRGEWTEVRRWDEPTQ